MGVRELLRYLEKLEIGLSSFSYEELGIVEAGELKKSFEVFKNGLEDKVFGISEVRQLDQICQEMGIEPSSSNKLLERPQKQLKPSEKLFSLIQSFENTKLTKEQKELVAQLKSVAGDLEKSQDMANPDEVARMEIKVLETRISSQKVNLKPVLEECMGQMELLEEFIRIYKQNILEFIGSLKLNQEMQNLKGIQVACQKVMPSLRMMNTVELLDIVKQMDTTCKSDKDYKYLKFLYDHFLMEYPKVESLLDYEIKALKNM
ncbi:hypothetical protein [Flagellimonas nanhaiensis]|uniref:Uncharacterized protein n=1 Tax=Flagellimonas nanhaiensis TaxID=2292706 RepID=A0A371JUW2_9FLAO|nr:hypothetical protein [Allomuricauda nanhaiensis]RDY61605.1 hypothetical protein DX873_05475 [Allomuricauda nanhaiensis]